MNKRDTQQGRSEPMYATMDKQRELINACNLLCEFVAGKLPDGFEIVLHMSREESWIELLDLMNGSDFDFSADQGISTIDELCCVAIEAERQK